MNVSQYLMALADAQVRRWNALVAKRAIDVDITPTHVRVLHPTKGWRKISRKRLGL